MSVSPVCSCLSCPTHTPAAGRPSACGFYPSSSMTDAQWALVETLLPPPGNTGGRGGRPEKHPRRRVLDAIFYVVQGRDRLGGAAGGVSTGQDRLRALPSLGA